VELTEMIYREIGEIIKTIQYIEWNLCLRLKIDTLADLTLGQLKTMVISQGVFNEENADELCNVLDRRNDLVHKYFKRLDFEKHSENEPFLENQYRYLVNFSKQVDNFNDFLLDND
jgi:hypothetical protein